MKAAVDVNSRLFQLFDEMHERSGRLGRILTAIVSSKAPPAPLLFGGCYLAGTGTDAATEQAFVQGLLTERLLETEELVFWTAQAQAEDAAYRRWVNLGWAALAVVVVAALAVTAYIAYLGSEDVS